MRLSLTAGAALLLLLLFCSGFSVSAVAVGTSPASTDEFTTTTSPSAQEEFTMTTPSADTAASPQPQLPPQPPLVEPPVAKTPLRKAEILVIDKTKNTSSVVSITIESEANSPANLTEADLHRLKLASGLKCLPDQKANIFLLVHLNRNWRQKLSFVTQLLAYGYRQGSTNVAIVFFNAFTNIMATFGTDPVASKAELLLGLSQVQASMERDESTAVTEHWAQFQLDDALKAAHRYAKLFLHQFSLDARPSLLLSYFDDSAVITDATLAAAERVLQDFKSSGLFAASVSILQWPTSVPVPTKWAHAAQLLSSQPSYQVTGPTEDRLLGAVADLAESICNGTRVRV